MTTQERSRPQRVATIILDGAPQVPAEIHPARLALARRVAALPRVLLDTVAWGGFAAVVALVVIALSDVGIGRAALWAGGLIGIVVLAAAVVAMTGTRLDDLNENNRRAARPD